MFQLRSIPTLAISLAALAFVAWIASTRLAAAGLYADPPPPPAALAMHVSADGLRAPG